MAAAANTGALNNGASFFQRDADDPAQSRRTCKSEIHCLHSCRVPQGLLEVCQSEACPSGQSPRQTDQPHSQSNSGCVSKP